MHAIGHVRRGHRRRRAVPWRSRWEMRSKLGRDSHSWRHRGWLTGCETRANPIRCEPVVVPVRAGADADATPNDLLVQLTSGNFIGQRSVVNATERWLGIPFAQPPVGNLRFKAPVQITKPAKGVQTATQFGLSCPQLPSATLFGPQGEDCLTLNVWRPIGTDPKAELPVLVWFYVSHQAVLL